MGDKNNNFTNNDSENKNDFPAKVKSNQAKNHKDKPYYVPLSSGNKFGVFFSSLSASSLISLAILALIVAALPFVIFISQTRQDLRQRSSGSGGAYLTVYPNNTYSGDKIIITESGPADCAKGLSEPETTPSGGLTNCELISASTNCTDNCQITWQCVAGHVDSYMVNVVSDKCNAESYLNIKN